MRISYIHGGIVIPKDMKCRWGKFSVGREVVDEDPILMMRLMRHVIVHKADYDPASQTIEYTATSPYFEPIPEHQKAPDYSIIFTQEDGHITKVEWKKTEWVEGAYPVGPSLSDGEKWKSPAGKTWC